MNITYNVLADINNHMTVAFYLHGDMFVIIAGNVDEVTERIKMVMGVVQE